MIQLRGALPFTAFQATKVHKILGPLPHLPPWAKKLSDLPDAIVDGKPIYNDKARPKQKTEQQKK